MGAALQHFATDTTCNDTGNPMADPTSYSARWIRLLAIADRTDRAS